MSWVLGRTSSVFFKQTMMEGRLRRSLFGMPLREATREADAAEGEVSQVSQGYGGALFFLFVFFVLCFFLVPFCWFLLFFGVPDGFCLLLLETCCVFFGFA